MVYLGSFFTVMSPDQVADAVFTAIEEERFYIITHPEFNEMVRKRMEDILGGRNPTVLLPATGDSPGKSDNLKVAANPFSMLAEF